MNDCMTEAEKLQLREAAERLCREFAGRFNSAIIERFIHESLESLLPGAKTTRWVPLLAERHARDRLRALRLLESDPAFRAPGILFLCVHNAGRSQIAAGWARHFGGDRIEVFAGGSEPAEAINPVAVEAMAEKGIDISGELPQRWSTDVIRAADAVVVMGCGDECPVFPGKRYVDWEIEDPAGKTLAEVRPIRDELEQRVRILLAELGVLVGERAQA